MNLSEMSHNARLAILVNRYATPLAILLVSLGVILSQPFEPVRNASIGLLAFGIVFNIFVVGHIKRRGAVQPWIIKTRLMINLAVNIVLVYLLGGYWSPIWLLLALTPIATAIYDTKAKTLLASVGVSLVLLIVHALRRLHSPLDWGQQIAHGLFIILLSLMINELASLVRRPEPL